MATSDELNELRERIIRLPAGDQLSLLESVLATIREERLPDIEAAKQEIAAYAAWHAERKHSGAEARREAVPCSVETISLAG